MGDRLPQLLDCRGIMAELGVKRATAEAIMRHCERIRVPGHRKTFVRRSEAEQRLEEWTVNADGFPKTA